MVEGYSRTSSYRPGQQIYIPLLNVLYIVLLKRIYLLNMLPKKWAKFLTKFRCSNHKLPIERLRYTNVPREERHCPFCFILPEYVCICVFLFFFWFFMSVMYACVWFHFICLSFVYVLLMFVFFVFADCICILILILRRRINIVLSCLVLKR